MLPAIFNWKGFNISSQVWAASRAAEIILTLQLKQEVSHQFSEVPLRIVKTRVKETTI